MNGVDDPTTRTICITVGAMTRTMKLAATAALGLSLAFSVAACGDEQEASTADDSTSTTVTGPPSDRSVPVVPGRKPTTNESADPSATESDDTADDNAKSSCGIGKGPEGSLKLVVVEGDVSCDTVKSVADEYSPKMALGGEQNIDGWTCAPSSAPGEMSRCTKGSQAFAYLLPE